MAYAAEEACSKGCDCEVIDVMVVSAAFKIVLKLVLGYEMDYESEKGGQEEGSMAFAATRLSRSRRCDAFGWDRG